MGRSRGIALLAALVFIAILGVLITSLLERVPFASAESRSACVRVQHELDVNSALQLAIGILHADAAENGSDSFFDLWARPHKARVGGTEVEVRLGDSAFTRAPEDEWIRRDLGVPKGVDLAASDDAYVHELFGRTKPNINTSPMTSLRRTAGLNAGAVAWVANRRETGAITGPEDLRDAPGFGDSASGGAPEGIAFASSLFLVNATIRREGRPPENHSWVLTRHGADVDVVYCGSGGALP